MKIGIIGAGNIAGKMAETLNGMETATCYAVASRELAKAQEFAKQYAIEKAYGSYEEMLQDEAVELVYVATPHSHHYDHMKLCIEHGKSILCEKAFTVNEKQAKEILDLAKEKGVFVGEAIWTRYLPSRKMIDDIIASGKIGEVMSVTANLGYELTAIPRMVLPELAGGALLDLGVYVLNFASMFLGNDVEEIISTCTKYETGVDIQEAMILKYADGKLATLHCGALAATEQYGMIYGTKGYIMAKNINNIDAIEVYNLERELTETLTVPEQITGFEYQVESCIKAIEAGELECAAMPHHEILTIMRYMDQIRTQWGIVYPFE